MQDVPQYSRAPYMWSTHRAHTQCHTHLSKRVIVGMTRFTASYYLCTWKCSRKRTKNRNAHAIIPIYTHAKLPIQANRDTRLGHVKGQAKLTCSNRASWRSPRSVTTGGQALLRISCNLDTGFQGATTQIALCQNSACIWGLRFALPTHSPWCGTIQAL